jgi:hypothetical protein
MSLAEVRSNIVSVMREALPAVNVAEHGGPINSAEIKRWATKSPAIRVACLGVPKVELGARILMDASWAAFCVESDRPGTANHRDMRVLLLAQSAIGVIGQHAQRWNLKATGVPDSITAVNLYAQDIDGMGVALWAVRWRQVVDINVVDVTSLDNFETFFAQYTIGPTDDTPVTEQNITLEGPWP